MICEHAPTHFSIFRMRRGLPGLVRQMIASLFHYLLPVFHCAARAGNNAEIRMQGRDGNHINGIKNIGFLRRAAVMLCKLALVAGLFHAAQVRAEPVVIELRGDSTGLGIDGGLLAKNASDIRVVSQPPQAFIHLAGVVIRNVSVSGESTATMLNGHFSGHPWEQAAQGDCADIVIFNYGINDSLTLDEKTYADNLETLIRISRDNNLEVFLQTPNPSRLTKVANYAQIMRDIARKHGISLIDVQQYLSARIPSGQLRNFMPDGIHPNQEGYALIGKFMQGRLRDLLLRRNLIALARGDAHAVLRDGVWHGRFSYGRKPALGQAANSCQKRRT